MKSLLLIIISVVLCFSAESKVNELYSGALIIDHNCTNFSLIPVVNIKQAKQTLIVAYGHTSHGSQIISGMSELDDFTSSIGFEKGLFEFNNQGSNNALKILDTPFSGADDLGSPDFISWEAATRDYLKINNEVNVVMWSWCGQVSWASTNEINTYLQLMTGLENDFTNVKFIYMTGHLDGSGVEGTLNINNNLIRDYCRENGKILYDFADIESFDPEAQVNYIELYANDNCDYISNEGNEKNWAIEWQDSHTENVDWYNCSVAHSQALNGNRKAYAAWWLFASLAGWQADTSNNSSTKAQFTNNLLKSWVENGLCNIQIPDNFKIKTINIYNHIGQLVLNQKQNEEIKLNDKLIIDLSNLPENSNNNLLFLQITCENGIYYSKLIIQ